MIFWGMALVDLLMPVAVRGATHRMDAKGAGASGESPEFLGPGPREEDSDGEPDFRGDSRGYGRGGACT